MPLAAIARLIASNICIEPTEMPCHQSAKQCRNGRTRSAAEVAGLEVQRGSALRLYRRPSIYGQRGLQKHPHQAIVIHSITSSVGKSSVGSTSRRFAHATHLAPDTRAASDNLASNAYTLAASFQDLIPSVFGKPLLAT